MGIMDDIDREVNKVKENPDVNKFKKGLEKGINTFKEEWEKSADKDSEIIDAEYTTKIPENEINSYNEPKFCPKCGANTKPNYKFCRNCGNQLIDFNQAENESEKDDKNFDIANKSETEDSQKGFKIPISYKNSDKPKKSIKESNDFIKEKNTNLNMHNNIKKENEESINIMDEDIKKENEENINIMHNNIKKENEESINIMDEDIKKENEENINSYSVADEIYKFYELKEQGIITSEEFEKKKRQLLDL